MTSGCPTASSVQAGQVGLFGRAQETPAATGCPTAFEQVGPIPSLPEGRSQEREETSEAVAPLAQEGAEAQEEIDQQRGPHLPAHGVGVVAEKVGQLEGLFEFLEEHLDAPAAAIEVGDGLGAPRQVVGEEHHFAQFAIHLDLGHDPAQWNGIGFLGVWIGQLDQIVAQDMALGAVLKLAPDPALEVGLGAGDPEDLTHGEVGQVVEVQVSLVEDDNLPGLHAGAEFMGPQVVVFAGGVHDGKAGQEGLEVEAHVTLGGGFAAPVLGPIHAPGHQRNGGGVHDVDEAFETEGELGASPATKAGMELLQMLEHRPEELLGQLRVAFPVGVGEGVLARRGGPANRRQGTGVQPQRIAHVVESQGVGQLGVEQADHMAPRPKRPGLGVYPGVPGQLRHEMSGNEIAELVQQRELAARWLVAGCFFHGLPCGRSTHRKPTSSSTRYSQLTKPVGQQCKKIHEKKACRPSANGL